MSKRKRNASDPRGGEAAGEGTPGRSVRGGGTSTDCTSAQTFAQHNSDSTTTVAAFGGTTSCTIANCVLCAIREANDSTYSNPHRGSTFEAKDFIGNTTPSVALKTVEQQQAFAEAVVDHEGIKPAARAWGLKSSAVFFHASTHQDFRKILNAAQGAVFESQVYKLDELCNKLLTMEPREMNQCANAYGRVFDYRMRIVGKLLPVIYGDKPGTQVNIQNNTGIVCTEEQREKLIQMNQKLLTAGAQTKQLDQ